MKTKAHLIGEAIHHDRERMQASQAEVANYVGVSQQAYSGWELGASVPRQGRMSRLIEYFGQESATAKAAGMYCHFNQEAGQKLEKVELLAALAQAALGVDLARNALEEANVQLARVTKLLRAQ